MSEIQEARKAGRPDREGTETTDPKILLGHHLKKLKLPTILAEYDKQARQCANEGIDYPRLRIPVIATGCSGASRPSVPIDRDQLEGGGFSAAG